MGKSAFKGLQRTAGCQEATKNAAARTVSDVVNTFYLSCVTVTHERFTMT